MAEMVFCKLTGGPLDGIEIPHNPFLSGKEWLVVSASGKLPMWRIRQGWELDKKPDKIAEGRYLYRLSHKSAKSITYTFVQGPGPVRCV